MTDRQNGIEARVAADPRYAALVRDRRRFSWTLAGITAAVYTFFISLIAFDKALLARPIGDGYTTIAVLAGAGMLIGPVAICALYVARANGEYDRRLAELLRDAGA